MAINNNLYTAMTSTANNESSDGSWFEAMAEAWGEALDKQAHKIEAASTEIGEQGQELPSQITELTAETLRMSFISNSSHTALTSLGNSLDTMARKQ
jgi:hypothetical protein